MSLNLYDVNKSLLSASLLLAATVSSYAQNWESKTEYNGKVSYFRYAEKAILRVNNCQFIKKEEGLTKLWGKCSFTIEEPGKKPETITMKENEEYTVLTVKQKEKTCNTY